MHFPSSFINLCAAACVAVIVAPSTGARPLNNLIARDTYEDTPYPCYPSFPGFDGTQSDCAGASPSTSGDGSGNGSGDGSSTVNGAGNGANGFRTGDGVGDGEGNGNGDNSGNGNGNGDGYLVNANVGGNGGDPFIGVGAFGNGGNPFIDVSAFGNGQDAGRGGGGNSPFISANVGRRDGSFAEANVDALLGEDSSLLHEGGEGGLLRVGLGDLNPVKIGR